MGPSKHVIEMMVKQYSALKNTSEGNDEECIQTKVEVLMNAQATMARYIATAQKWISYIFGD